MESLSKCNATVGGGQVRAHSCESGIGRGTAAHRFGAANATVVASHVGKVKEARVRGGGFGNIPRKGPQQCCLPPAPGSQELDDILATLGHVHASFPGPQVRGAPRALVSSSEAQDAVPATIPGAWGDRGSGLRASGSGTGGDHVHGLWRPIKPRPKCQSNPVAGRGAQRPAWPQQVHQQ